MANFWLGGMSTLYQTDVNISSAASQLIRMLVVVFRNDFHWSDRIQKRQTKTKN